jgi:hypothetical protein
MTTTTTTASLGSEVERSRQHEARTRDVVGRNVVGEIDDGRSGRRRSDHGPGDAGVEFVAPVIREEHDGARHAVTPR